MNYAQINKDSDHVVTVVLDDPDKSVNVMNDAFATGLEQIVEKLEADIDGIAGVIITSAKKTFFAGGDLEEIVAVNEANRDAYFTKVEGIKANMRRLESLGKPVVAAINGAALGGGYEICLATHHRVAINQPGVPVGLPEVTLGLLPGGCGVVRLVRLLGLQRALPILLAGKALPSAKAQELGLVDQLADNKDDMLAKAKAWILANPTAIQPWDQAGYEYPGGQVDEPEIEKFISATSENLQATHKGLYPAPTTILSTAVESMKVDFAKASSLETSALVGLAMGSVSKNMITTFFQMNQIKGGQSRPKDVAKSSFSKIGILGAGMMGSGIAYCAAKAGLDVVLKDVTIAQAEKGKAYSDALCTKLIGRDQMTEQHKQALLTRISVTENPADLAGCELVIEAVFENRDLKATVTQEAEAHLPDDCVFASNTSSLPITGLAEASRDPSQFIGLHFFSPVDRMQLVEIICGKQTSDETLAKGYDFVTAIRKTPIVVNDSRDFYTSRVYESYCDEGAWLMADGVNPEVIENAARQAGMPAGPLASVDAVSQKLIYSIKSMAKSDWEAEHGTDYLKATEPPFTFVERMVTEFDRAGKAHGAGYFDYPENGKKVFWPGLKDIMPADNKSITIDDVKDRFLFRQSIEAVRCLEEGVLRSVADCNIGSMLGIAFPKYTGGQLQFINSYGLPAFVARATELADQFGERFRPPTLLHDMVQSGERFE